MRLWSRPLIVAGMGVVPQGPEEGPAAVPAGGGRAWPGFEKTRRANHQHTRLHWCGGCRRVRRARAGFEARRRTKSGCLASRVAGPSGARNTRGTTSTPREQAKLRTTKPPGPTGDRAAHASGR